MKRYPVPRRGWVWLIVFAVLVVLALVRLAVFFGAESPLVPLPPTTGPFATPNVVPQSRLSNTPQQGMTATLARTDTPVPTLTATRPSPTPTSRPTSTTTHRPSPTATRLATPTATWSRTPTASSPGFFIPTPVPGERLPTIGYDGLPVEAQEVIALIEKGGPFPYRQDGATFQNRERLLPTKPSGYYREYTVETPGSNDRGARRIVAGQQGELYYTADHYASFQRVIP